MNKILSAMLLVTLSGLSVNGLADENDDEEELGAGTEKTVLCHKGKNSISVGAPGRSAHLGHGDKEGYCQEGTEPGEPEGSDTKAAVVMMHCEGVEGTVQVTSFSSSAVFVEQPLSEIGTGDDCADALAALLYAGYHLKSVTGNTDYLLVGETED
jgi:hypothetical protein